MYRNLKRKHIQVRQSTIDNYGVFAAENIPTDSIIEECYTLFHSEYYAGFKNYYFHCEEASALALGFGSIYNHSDNPNAAYFLDRENSIIVFKALRVINKNEEILISYGKQWFSDRNIKPIKPSWKNIVFKKMPLIKTLIRAAIIVGLIVMIKMIA